MLAGLEDHELGIRCVEIKVNESPLEWGQKDADINVDENADN